MAALGRSTVIAEVQRAPDLLLAVKARLDRDRRRGQFLLTGSANLRRIPTVADALPGRIDYLTLWPLTQGEIEGRREDFLDRVFDGEVPMLTDAPVGRSEYAPRLLTVGSPSRSPEPEPLGHGSLRVTSARSSTAIWPMPRVFMTRARSGRCCD